METFSNVSVYVVKPFTKLKNSEKNRNFEKFCKKLTILAIESKIKEFLITNVPSNDFELSFNFSSVEDGKKCTFEKIKTLMKEAQKEEIEILLVIENE